VDRTIRIWNTYGTDLGYRKLWASDNFPMADADEGSHIIAVLANWRWGHRAEVDALVSQNRKAWPDE
jgi:hypothetical protein